MYIDINYLELFTIFSMTCQVQSMDCGAYTIKRRAYSIEASFSDGSIVELVEIRQHDGLNSLSGYRLISYDENLTVTKDNFYRLL